VLRLFLFPMILATVAAANNELHKKWANEGK
jgi:hypothetical protein